ncbi:CU044_5270 family protein [Streptomyces sp. c-19]|uniref:CU044_5270 family protein n=1 Tax=Streptomyces sp. c-19 TaxID=2789275 RepID=UPI0039804732
MSAKQSRPTPAEHEELVQLLRVPSERDLPGRRHQILKDHLLRESRRAGGEGAGLRALPRRRLVLAAVPLAAGAVAAVTVATGGLLDRPSRAVASPTAAAPDAVASGRAGGGTASTPATVLLDRIATVAASRPAPVVRDGQYVYVVSTVAYSSQSDTDPVMRLEAPHRREIWHSVDGGRPGLLRVKGQDVELVTLPEDLPPQGRSGGKNHRPENASPTLNSPTYRYLESLPTDPEALLERIYRETAGSGPGPDEQAFVTIGDLLREQLAPPEVSAALYRAAARIPGVTVVDDSVDAAGRHGVAVARTHAGERTEWIFDKNTLEFLGERGVMVEDTAWAKAGQITATTAVLNRGISDKAGESSQRAN